MDKQIRLDEVESASRRSRLLLSVCGLNFKYRHHGLYLLYIASNAFLGLSFLFYSLYYYRHKIEKLAVVAHHAMLVIDVIAAPVLGYIFKNNSDILLNDAYWSYNYHSSIMQKKLKEVKKVGSDNIKRMFKYVKYSTIYALIDINGLAAFEGYLMGDNKQTLFPCWYPFELDTYLAYLAVNLWQESIVFHFVIVVFGSLVMSHYIYTHVKTEVELLNFAIANMEERAYEMAGGRGAGDANPDQLKLCYIRCTKMCAQHHSYIIRYFYSGTTNFIEIMYCFVLLTGLVVCTCTGFALISDNMALKVKFIGITVIELIYLYLMCWFPEALTKVSLEVSEAIYQMEWFKLPKESRSNMMVMLIRSGKPLHMKMATGPKVDLEGYMALIKASYSYFNMMLAMAE